MFIKLSKWLHFKLRQGQGTSHVSHVTCDERAALIKFDRIALNNQWQWIINVCLTTRVYTGPNVHGHNIMLDSLNTSVAFKFPTILKN